MSLPYAYLFVPGDAERKIDKAASGDAGAIILDLEDSVAPARKDEALRITRDFLSARPARPSPPEIWVRLNAADPDTALAELTALPLGRITGVFHPKLPAHDQLVRMGHWLDALEKRDGLVATSIKIVGIISESADALVGEQTASLARGHPRLRGYYLGRRRPVGRPGACAADDCGASRSPDRGIGPTALSVYGRGGRGRGHRQHQHGDSRCRCAGRDL
jgi:citrate lyase subunit beta/citryl-CoA lyase